MTFPFYRKKLPLTHNHTCYILLDEDLLMHRRNPFTFWANIDESTENGSNFKTLTKQLYKSTVITGVLPAPVYNPHPPKSEEYVLKFGV